ncbi:MAG: hypothetical protein RL758_36 [Pseudomonadota bacterium]|jgi:hypothetical protein
MSAYQCSEERVLKDLASHEMQVIRDEGVHRHIRFKRPDSGSYWFDLITWPGTLCIDGDCGTYVFRRLDDMFEFFRTDREYLERKGCQLAINPGYWGEKLQSISKFGEGFKEFSEQRFRDAVKEEFDAWVESDDPTDDAKAALWEELEDRVLSCASDGHIRAVDAAIAFEPDDGEVMFEMRDFWEHRLEDYTFHFIWCCYAIAWGIKKYDEVMQLALKEAA